MTTRSVDDELYDRSVATLLASWDAIARGTATGRVVRRPGLAAAIFPEGPERAIYNNAVLDRRLRPGEPRAAIDAMEALYGTAGVDDFAAWVHERDAPMRQALDERGYTVAETTRAMGMRLDELTPPPTEAAEHRLEVLTWAAYRSSFPDHGIPADLLAGTDPTAFRAIGACAGDALVSVGLAFDHDADCGIFNVGTLPSARRRGLGSSVTRRLVTDARRDRCTTATLQATEMAEGVYASLGFRDLGRILEHRR